MKVACQKCDTLVTDFPKLKDVLGETVTFEGLRAEATRFGEGESVTFWDNLTTNTSGYYRLY